MGVDCTSFALGFFASESIAWSSEAGLRMIKMVTEGVIEHAKREMRRGIAALEGYIPSGDTPLDEPVKAPGEKGTPAHRGCGG